MKRELRDLREQMDGYRSMISYAKQVQKDDYFNAQCAIYEERIAIQKANLDRLRDMRKNAPQIIDDNKQKIVATRQKMLILKNAAKIQQLLDALAKKEAFNANT